MTSTLIIESQKEIQNRITSVIKSFKNIPGVYVSLNKSKKSTEYVLKKAGINTNNLFFIDCVTSEKTKDDVIHIPPTDLSLLRCAIQEFIKNINGKDFLIIDAFATLLIYNTESKVVKFVKEMTELASKYDTELIAFSPETKEDDLLNRTYGFFENVKRK